LPELFLGRIPPQTPTNGHCLPNVTARRRHDLSPGYWEDALGRTDTIVSPPASSGNGKPRWLFQSAPASPGRGVLGVPLKSTALRSRPRPPLLSTPEIPIVAQAEK
jgi:hypothetical protein